MLVYGFLEAKLKNVNFETAFWIVSICSGVLIGEV